MTLVEEVVSNSEAVIYHALDREGRLMLAGPFLNARASR
jgi:hypothetical protein